MNNMLYKLEAEGTETKIGEGIEKEIQIEEKRGRPGLFSARPSVIYYVRRQNTSD